jgi:hypothetical protein
MSTDARRRILLIDAPVQGTLLLRIGFYWMFFGIAVVLLESCWLAATERPASSAELIYRVRTTVAPGLLASVLLLPLVLIDCLRLSNRFAGPAFRLRRALRDLVEGREVRPQHLRESDFWQDFAEDFNRLLEQRNAAAPSATSAGGAELEGDVPCEIELEGDVPCEVERGGDAPCAPDAPDAPDAAAVLAR